MSTFGKTDVGANTANYVTGNYKQGSRYQLTEDGDVTKITLRCKYKQTGACNVKCAIYSDSGGAPDALQGESQVVSVDDTWAWRDFTFASPISLSAGYYWLCLLGVDDVYIAWDTGYTNQAAWNADAYADGFSDPFGTPGYVDREISIYATYTVGVAHSKTVTELLGLVDSHTYNKWTLHKKTVTELLGLSDSIVYAHGHYFTVTELLGLVDTWDKNKCLKCKVNVICIF